MNRCILPAIVLLVAAASYNLGQEVPQPQEVAKPGEDSGRTVE